MVANNKMVEFKYAVVHMYDAGSSHPEVDVSYYTTRVEALAEVENILGSDPKDHESDESDEVVREWSLGENEGWVRIDEVK